MRALATLTALALPLALAVPASGAGDGPEPGSPEYVARDTQNIADAYGRIHGEGGQLRNPAYLPALVADSTQTGVDQLLQQLAAPTRPAISPGNLAPGWNVGNPLRDGWAGTRGRVREVAYPNRHGALLRGHVYAPSRGARDPYTGRRLQAPYPGVVITTGSVQGSEGMYEWLAQDLAERGYVVLTYDVQGQGTSETFPHDGTLDGVPSQQLANFVVGTRDSLSFFTSTPGDRYRGDTFNPFWRLFDRSPDRRTATPGRTDRIAVVGHSLGAAAVSRVQAVDDRVAAVVALDKLQGSGEFAGEEADNTPVVPALALQAEYGFTVSPWFLSGGSSLMPQPSPDGPDPARERRTGFDDWHDAGVDSMLVVPRASTHLEWTDIPLVLPASRWGQALSSVYVQAWLDRYLEHRDNTGRLLGRSFRYLEPTGDGEWTPVRLRRDPLLSFYYCSAYSLGEQYDGDIADAGC